MTTMLTMADKKEDEKKLERLTIRVDREFNEWLDDVAAYKGVDKSKITRWAIEEWTERHAVELTPKLFKWLHDWKERRRRRKGLL
jgi:hypothetical protein